MKRKSLLLSQVVLFVIILSSCTGSVQVRVPPPPGVRVRVNAPPPPTPPPPPSVTIQASSPELVEGVVTISPSCTTGAPEVLNGIDDNCDGRVDEGFVQSGAVQITLGWSTGADIDLYVIDPFNEEISYRNTNSSSGGHLDRDARGACTNGDTTENVYFPQGNAPRGTYRVAVHYFSNCQAAAVTPVTLSIMVGGQALGVYQYNLTPGTRVDMASFVIP